jgi:hypothetical protein
MKQVAQFAILVLAILLAGEPPMAAGACGQAMHSNFGRCVWCCHRASGMSGMGGMIGAMAAGMPVPPAALSTTVSEDASRDYAICPNCQRTSQNAPQFAVPSNAALNLAVPAWTRPGDVAPSREFAPSTEASPGRRAPGLYLLFRVFRI